MMRGCWCHVYSKKQRNKPTEKNKQMKRIPPPHSETYKTCKTVADPV